MLFLGSVSSVSLSEKEGRIRGGKVEILGESMPAVRESSTGGPLPKEGVAVAES